MQNYCPSVRLPNPHCLFYHSTTPSELLSKSCFLYSLLTASSSPLLPHSLPLALYCPFRSSTTSPLLSLAPQLAHSLYSPSLHLLPLSCLPYCSFTLLLPHSPLRTLTIPSLPHLPLCPQHFYRTLTASTRKHLLLPIHCPNRPTPNFSAPSLAQTTQIFSPILLFPTSTMTKP